MNHPGWLLIILGLVIATIGLVWLLAPSVPWFGRLPGDIVIERGQSRFYFPGHNLHRRELGVEWVDVAGTTFWWMKAARHENQRHAYP